jgi:hypothetical protein
MQRPQWPLSALVRISIQQRKMSIAMETDEVCLSNDVQWVRRRAIAREENPLAVDGTARERDLGSIGRQRNLEHASGNKMR